MGEWPQRYSVTSGKHQEVANTEPIKPYPENRATVGGPFLQCTMIMMALAANYGKVKFTK